MHHTINPRGQRDALPTRIGAKRAKGTSNA
jgi:hypothetical protein